MEAISLGTFAALVVLAWFVFRADDGWFWTLRRRLALSDRILREDALKYFARCEIEGEAASLRGAAGSLGVDGGTTSHIVDQLAEDGLMMIEGGEFHLTEDGRSYGLRMIRAHRLYETYMSEKTGFRGDEWHERAERAEHELSEDDLRALERALAYPVSDPHGDPIPDPNGTIVQPEGIVGLGEVGIGQRCRIAHLEDEPAVVFREIDAVGLFPGQEIEVREVDAAGVGIVADNGEHRLSRLAATNVQVIPQDAVPEPIEAEKEPGGMLADAPANEPRRILGISPRISGSERRRLMDLGFLPGTTIVKEFASASGNPIAYRVRGSLMALRRSQAENILVETTAPTGSRSEQTPQAGSAQ